MQPTTRFHDHVPNPVFQEADGVFYNSVAFDPANGMFYPDANRRDPTIGGFFRGREFPTPRFFLGLKNRDTREDEPLKAHILIEATPRGKRIAGQLRETLLMRFAFSRITQEHNVTGIIDHQEVFDRVTFLLPTVILLLLLGIFRALDRAFRPIMQKRGDVEAPAV